MQDAELRALGPVRSGDPAAVLGRPDGQPLHPQRLADQFQAAAWEVGLPVIRLHDARHSCATLALSAGNHPKLRIHASSRRSPASHRELLGAQHPAQGGADRSDVHIQVYRRRR